jgi:hypothetical protein
MMPGGFSLLIYRGDTHAWRFTLWQDVEKTEPVDLTGINVKAEIRDRAAGAVIQSIALAVTQPNIIDAKLTAAETSALLVSGVWDLQLTDPSGWVSTILAGSVKVVGDVTDSSGEPVGGRARRAGYLVGAEG